MLKEGNRKVLFLDRDGPINIVGPHGFVHKPEFFHFTDGIFNVCKEATEKEYKIIIITNQTGIGLGDYTEKDMESVHDKMKEDFLKQGIRIADVIYTSFTTSPNRKPSPGMYLLAKTKFEMTDDDMFMSCSIGDRKKDAEAALRAGVGRVYYYQTNKALNTKWKVISKKSVGLVKEITELKAEFQTLAILGALAKAMGLERKPQSERHNKQIIKSHNNPKLFLIRKLKELEGHL